MRFNAVAKNLSYSGESGHSIGIIAPDAAALELIIIAGITAGLVLTLLYGVTWYVFGGVWI